MLLFTAVVFQLFSDVLCQFQMPFPMSQMGGFPPQMAAMGAHNMAPMGPLPPMGQGQAMFPQPMSMPMAYPMQRKMPSVVMPSFSNNRRSRSFEGRPERQYRRKRRMPRKYDKHEDNDSDNEYSESGSEEQNFRRMKTKKRRQVLTPVVSYVTKDGYVVYQKKIKKDKAKEWLEMTKKMESKEIFTSAEEKQFQKMLKYKKKKKHQH